MDFLKIKFDFHFSSKNGRNKKNRYYNKNMLSQEIYNTKDFLPKINQFNSLNITKKIHDKKMFVPQKIKYLHKMNILNNFIKNDFNNIIPIKEPYLINKEKFKQIFDYRNYKNRSNENKFLLSSINFDNKINYNKEENDLFIRKNKKKDLKEIINIYCNKEEPGKKKFSNSENKVINKNNNSKDDKVEDKIVKKNFMFMTEMNFLIKNRNENKMKIKNSINKTNKNLEKKAKKTIDYDSLNLKELIKYIEKNKRRIIYNQNEIDNMLKTTRDTYHEIRKINH